MSTSRIIRQRIWEKLNAVALPDTRFHMNFAEVIPDFIGSADERSFAPVAATSRATSS